MDLKNIYDPVDLCEVKLKIKDNKIVEYFKKKGNSLNSNYFFFLLKE